MYITGMIAKQSFYLVMTPGLILAGFFFGLTGILALFIPPYVVFQMHVHKWTVWQVTYRMTLAFFAPLFLYAFFSGVFNV